MSGLQNLIRKYPNSNANYIKKLFQQYKSLEKVEQFLNQNSNQKEETNEEKVQRLLKEFPSLSNVQVISYLERNNYNLDQTIQHIKDDLLLESLKQAPSDEEEEEDQNQLPIDDNMDLNGIQLIDFHKYSCRQVSKYLQVLFAGLRQTHSKHRITIITGKGKHSLDGVAHIRRQVIKMAYKSNFHTEIDPTNAGQVFLYPDMEAQSSDFEEEEEELFDPTGEFFRK